MNLPGLGISKAESLRIQLENIRMNHEIDEMTQKICWSDYPKTEKWEPDLDYLVVVLMPRKWWSWTAWKLAIGVRKHVRLGFNPPVGK